MTGVTPITAHFPKRSACHQFCTSTQVVITFLKTGIGGIVWVDVRMEKSVGRYVYLNTDGRRLCGDPI
jgi:hypothetical protein